jgi:hypothetical protein
VNTEYEDEERRLEPPPVVTDFKSLIRNVLVDKPKVTRSVPRYPWHMRTSELIVRVFAPFRRFSVPWDSDAKTLSNPWTDTTPLDSLSTAGASNGGMEGTQSLDAPIPTSNANPAENIYNSPLPPPIQAAAPAMTTEERAVDVEMA